MQAYIYILTNRINSTLYTGVTNNLIRRVYEHKQGLVEGFSKKYQLQKLVYFDACTSMYEAIAAEKRIKRWHRKWKLELIERDNPDWIDLYNELGLAQDPR